MSAYEWLRRGLSSGDPIDALSNFWRSFNSLYFSTNGSDERDKIKSYLSANITPEQAQKIIDTNPLNIDYLLSLPVVDMRGNGRDTSQYISAFNKAGDPKVKILELFMIIYQVRCNLEHGQKSTDGDRDLCLCKCAAQLIASVLMTLPQ